MKASISPKKKTMPSVRAMTFLTVFLLAFALAVALPGGALAATRVGTVTSIKGSATVSRGGSKRFITAKRGTQIYLNDTIKTEAGAKLRVTFLDKSIISLGPTSSIVVNEYVYRPKKKVRSSRLRLLWGKVKCYVNDVTGYRTKKFNVNTNTAVIGVRGTVFVVVQNPDGSTTVASFENDVFVETAGMEGDFVIVAANTSTVVKKGSLPGNIIRITPEQRLQLEEGLFQVDPEGNVIFEETGGTGGTEGTGGTGGGEQINLDTTTTTYPTTTTTTTTTSTTTTTTEPTSATLPGFPAPPGG